MSKLNDQVIVITGASKGIGAAIARTAAREGAKVVVNFRADEAAAAAVVSSVEKDGGVAVAIPADVTRADEVRRLFSETQSRFGRLDTLVNNAGVYTFQPVEAITESEWRRQMDHNVYGPFLCIQEALKYFGPEGGSIINVGSVASVKATPASTLYSATKGALDAITRTLSKELGSRQIRVNAVLPGPTHTEGNPVLGSEMEGFIVSHTPLGRLGTPQDTAALVTFLATKEAGWITGQKIVVSGGFD